MEDRCLTDGHCWHVTSTLTVNPPITVRQCCWCGDERRDQERFVNQREHGTRVLLPRTFDGGVFDNGMTDAELGYLKTRGRDLGLTRFKDCPSCGQRTALVGAEWWHERPYVEGLHPRDCEKRVKLLEGGKVTMPTELEIWKTVAAKLAFLLTKDEGAAAAVLAACVDQERAERAIGDGSLSQPESTEADPSGPDAPEAH